MCRHHRAVSRARSCSGRRGATEGSCERRRVNSLLFWSGVRSRTRPCLCLPRAPTGVFFSYSAPSAVFYSIYLYARVRSVPYVFGVTTPLPLVRGCLAHPNRRSVVPGYGWRTCVYRVVRQCTAVFRRIRFNSVRDCRHRRGYTVANRRLNVVILPPFLSPPSSHIKHRFTRSVHGFNTMSW